MILAAMRWPGPASHSCVVTSDDAAVVPAWCSVGAIQQSATAGVRVDEVAANMMMLALTGLKGGCQLLVFNATCCSQATEQLNQILSSLCVRHRCLLLQTFAKAADSSFQYIHCCWYQSQHTIHVCKLAKNQPTCVPASGSFSVSFMMTCVGPQ
jgi:hypothetical protein